MGTLPFGDSAIWGLCLLGTLPFGDLRDFLKGKCRARILRPSKSISSGFRYFLAPAVVRSKSYLPIRCRRRGTQSTAWEGGRRTTRTIADDEAVEPDEEHEGAEAGGDAEREEHWGAITKDGERQWELSNTVTSWRTLNAMSMRAATSLYLS